MIPAQQSEPAATPAHLHLLESIKALARRASIETSTRNLVEIDAYPSVLPPGTDVYVAWIPGSPYHHIVSVAKRLQRAGMNPVPHIAARQLANREVATEYLASLRDEADVRRALIIAGDSDAPVGAYDSSAAVLESGLLQAHGIRSVGIAGYPEGHPKIPEATLMVALDRKIDYAAAHGLDLFMVTQFCFDGQAIVDWLGRLRARGAVLPVRVGVAGPATIRTLLSYGMRCGIGNSLRALSAHGRQVMQLLSSQGPESVAAALAGADPALGIAGWHLYAFGGFARTAGWTRNVAEGKVQWVEGGGFRVLDQ